MRDPAVAIRLPVKLAGLALTMALLLVCAALISACGSGGGASSASASIAAPSSASAESTAQTPGSVSFTKPHPRANAATEAEREKAGNAAAFVLPGADNSVPTFGREASAAERSEAQANLAAYLGARAAHRWSQACSLLAASVREGFEKLAASSKKSSAPSSCAKVLPTLAPIRPGVPADPLQGSLVAFRIHGANAFALFYGPPQRQQYMVPMNREGSAWRPTQAAPIAYPPGAQTQGAR